MCCHCQNEYYIMPSTLVLILYEHLPYGLLLIQDKSSGNTLVQIKHCRYYER